MKKTLAITALAVAALGFTLIVGNNQNVSNDAQVQNATDIAVDPNSPDHIIGGSNNLTGFTPRVRVYESLNAGQTWTTTLLALPSGFTNAADPAMTFDRHGNAYFAFITYTD